MPGLGYSFATSSYVAICSLSKSSFSAVSYIIFFVFGADAQCGLFGDWLQDKPSMGDAEHRAAERKFGYKYEMKNIRRRKNYLVDKVKIPQSKLLKVKKN